MAGLATVPGRGGWASLLWTVLAVGVLVTPMVLAEHGIISEELGPVLMAALFVSELAAWVAFVAIASVTVGRRERRRQQRFAAWAARHDGWYEAKPGRSLDGFDRLPPMDGQKAVTRHAIHGRAPRFTAFEAVADDVWTVYVRYLGMTAPPLRLVPERRWDRRPGGAARRDIEVESAAFSRAFLITCEDRRFVYDILTPAVQEHILRHLRGWVLDWQGRHLLLCAPVPLRPKEIVRLHAVTERLRALLPRHLYVDQGAWRIVDA